MTAETRMKYICNEIYNMTNEYVRNKLKGDVCLYKTIYLKTSTGEQISFNPKDNEFKFVLSYEQDGFENPLLEIKDGEVRFRYNRHDYFDTSLRKRIEESNDINEIKELAKKAIEQYEQPDQVINYIIEYISAIKDSCRELTYDEKTERIDNYNFELYNLFRNHMHQAAMEKMDIWKDRSIYTVGCAVDHIAKALWEPYQTQLQSTDLLDTAIIMPFEKYLEFIRVLEEKLMQKVNDYNKYQPGFVIRSEMITMLINEVLCELEIPTKLDTDKLFMELTEYNVIVKTDFSDHYVLVDDTTKDDIDEVKDSYRKSLKQKK